jgi:hypothetical protein
LAERKANPSDPAFPTISGTPLSHDGLQYLLNKHLSVACRQCPGAVAGLLQRGPHSRNFIIRGIVGVILALVGAQLTSLTIFTGVNGDSDLRAGQVRRSTIGKPPPISCWVGSAPPSLDAVQDVTYLIEARY